MRIALLVLAVVAFALNYHYGNRDINGLFYHEFDMAGRLFGGQLPFVDFFTIQGVMPAILQVAFFKVWGANYESLVIHAAVANALATVVVYWLLVELGATALPAFLSAVLTALVFYTPHAVPMPPQHSWLFALLIVALQIKALRTEHAMAVFGIYLLVGILAFMGYMSKPAPIGMFVPLSLFLIALSPMRFWPLALIAGGLGLTLAAAPLVAIAASGGADGGHTLWHYAVKLPLGIGAGRTSAGSFVFGILKIFAAAYRFNMGSFILLFGAIVAAFVLLAKTWFVERRQVSLSQVILPLAIGVWTLVVTIVFQGLSHHHYYLGMPLLFLSIGCLYVALKALVAERQEDEASPSCRILLASVFAIVAISDGLVFHMLGNVQRGWIHEYRNTRRVPDQMRFPGLTFVDFYGKLAKTGFGSLEITPAEVARELSAEKVVYDYVTSKPGNVLVVDFRYVTHTTTGKITVMPAMNAVPGFASPPAGTREFNTMFAILRNNIRKYGLTEIVLSPNYFRDNAALIKESNQAVCGTDVHPEFVALKVCVEAIDALPTFLLHLMGYYRKVESSYFRSTVSGR